MEMIAVAVLSGLFTSVFVYGLRTKGPWQSTWSFLLVLVVSLSAYSIWAPAAGPVWYGAAWIDLSVTGLFVCVILSAVTPSNARSDVLPGQRIKVIDERNKENNPIATKAER